MNNTNLILLAYSKSSHGIKGEFSIKLINEESLVLKAGITIFIKSKSSDMFSCLVENVRYGNKVILKVKDINSKTDSDNLLPIEIYVSKESLPELEEDEFYIMDLIGSKVYDFKNNEYVGDFVDYYENSVQTIMQINTGKNLIDVIFNKVFVKDVDVESKIIKIIVPEEID